MQRYLIEVPHSDDHEACVRALGATQRYGGHFATNVDWGCKGGVHSGWLIVEVKNRHQAMQMVAPEFRDEVRIVELNKFTREEIRSWVAELDD
jgi:hypothetical protein